MINPHLFVELRRAENVFRKRGQPNLARSARNLRGQLADTRVLDLRLEGQCTNVVNLAFGGTIHA